MLSWPAKKKEIIGQHVELASKKKEKIGQHVELAGKKKCSKIADV